MDMRGAWDTEVLERVLAFVRKHRWQERIVRPVLLFGPEDAWKWMTDAVPEDEKVELRDVWLGPCGRGFSLQWLKDHESLSYADLEQPASQVHDPWPIVVEMAAAHRPVKSIGEAMSLALNDDEKNRHVSDIIGISDTMDTAFRVLSISPGESITPDTISELSVVEGKDISPEEVVDFLSWAHPLGIVCKDEEGYRLDSTYAEGLKRILEG